MRVFRRFDEARGEIARDLNELGVTVFAGYQSRDIDAMTEEEKTKLTTKELINYGYVVLDPRMNDLNPTQPWAHEEWLDRVAGINGNPSNPGDSWKLRPEIWEPLLNEERRFSYTYSERLGRNQQVKRVVEEFRLHPTTRQAYISIWDSDLDSMRLGKQRVPCSLGYQLLIRNDQLDITYHMRSSDFATHWENDVWLALCLQGWIAARLDIAPGTFTHVLGSLHVYEAEVAHVF